MAFTCPLGATALWGTKKLHLSLIYLGQNPVSGDAPLPDSCHSWRTGYAWIPLIFCCYLTAVRILELEVHWSIIFVSFCSRTCRSKRTGCFLHLSLLFPHPADRKGIQSQVPNWTKHNSQNKPPKTPSVLSSMFVFGGVYEWATLLTSHSAFFSVDYIWKAFWKRYFYFV